MTLKNETPRLRRVFDAGEATPHAMAVACSRGGAQFGGRLRTKHRVKVGAGTRKRLDRTCDKTDADEADAEERSVLATKTTRSDEWQGPNSSKQRALEYVRRVSRGSDRNHRHSQTPTKANKLIITFATCVSSCLLLCMITVC